MSKLKHIVNISKHISELCEQTEAYSKHIKTYFRAMWANWSIFIYFFRAMCTNVRHIPNRVWHVERILFVQRRQLIWFVVIPEAVDSLVVWTSFNVSQASAQAFRLLTTKWMNEWTDTSLRYSTATEECVSNDFFRHSLDDSLASYWT